MVDYKNNNSCQDQRETVVVVVDVEYTLDLFERRFQGHPLEIFRIKLRGAARNQRCILVVIKTGKRIRYQRMTALYVAC